MSEQTIDAAAQTKQASQHQRWPASALEAMRENDPQEVLQRDRGLPLWTGLVSACFSAGTAVCLAILAIFAFYIHELVIVQQNALLAPILVTCAALPVIGVILFGWGHSRAMGGNLYLKAQNAARGSALIGFLGLIALAGAHPFLLLPPFVAILFGWVVCGPVAARLLAESPWSFDAREAVSFLSGRDQRALQLSNAKSQEPTWVPVLLLAMQLLCAVASYGLAAWLATRQVISPSAAMSVMLISTGSCYAFHRVFKHRSRIDPEHQDRAVLVTRKRPLEETEVSDSGLVVSDLNVRTADGRHLLHSININCPPGSIVGVCGDGFAGKSILLRAIAAPHDLAGLTVSGDIRINGSCAWHRSTHPHLLLLHHLPASPLMTQGSALNNLTCYEPERLERATRILKSLVFDSQLVDHLLSAQGIQELSMGQRKALSFARALCLQPDVFLVDRPEDGASEVLRNAFVTRMKEQTRAGATFLVVSEDRRFLEACSHLMILQNGRLIEFGPAQEIRQRQSSGWQRFVTELSLESEEALESWLRSQFRRDGDEGNRRKVCLIANELLALACRQKDLPDRPPNVHFDFKMMAGRCLIHLHLANANFSSGSFDLAREELERTGDLADLSPLARILQQAETVEYHVEDGQNLLQVSIAIYDPRLANSTPQSGTLNAPRR